jgi:hypothetical protein
MSSDFFWKSFSRRSQKILTPSPTTASRCQFTADSRRYPSTWTDIDEWDLTWPAYAYARHGMLDEVRKAGEAGEDTGFHYREGKQYYDYWSKHSEHSDTGVRSDETNCHATRLFKKLKLFSLDSFRL